MGRYISGTQGFTYKYKYAVQGSNLRALARASRAGSSRFEPLVSASMDKLERTDDFALMELLRESVRRSGRVGDELSTVLSRAETVGTGAFESLQRAVGESLVPLAAIIDEKLPEVAEHVIVCARATYELARDDRAKLLAYVQGFATKLALGDLADPDKIERAIEKIGDAGDHLPVLALRILEHATRHDLGTITVRETMPETTADEFWPKVRAEWGPLIFKRDPSTPAEWFARGLASFWAGDRKDAKASLAACGQERARRWLKSLGAKVPAKLAPTPPVVRDDAALDQFFAAAEVSDRWAAEPGLALAKLDELLRAHPIIDRTLARRILFRKRREHGDELAAASSSLPAGPARRAVEDYLGDERIAAASDRADVPALLTELATAAQRGFVGAGAASGALSAVLTHGDAAALRRTYEALVAVHPIDGAVPETPLAYNFACAAARLRRKPEMLAWLRVARLAGDDPADALDDSDFTAYHEDADLLALAK